MEQANYHPWRGWQAEADGYMKQVNSVVQVVMAANPKMKEDYEALLAAAKKNRK